MRFEAASGWRLLSRQGELVAANVQLAKQDTSLLSPPSHTVAALPRNGLLLRLL